MAEKDIFPYKFNRFEPALFVEIYLPKKIRYQGILYKTLRTGFNLGAVKRHLKKRSNFLQISEFMEDYEEIHEIYKKGDVKKIKDRVEKIQQSFIGYSMYEVDGVFFNKTDFDKHQYRKEKINKFIAEENVQVIRMVFMPDSKKILNDLSIKPEKDKGEFYAMRGFLKRVLEHQYECEYEIKQERKAMKESKNDEKEDEKILNNKEGIYNKISDWLDDVALFLFGFVIYNICEEIKKLQKEDERPEDEIWVTTFGNLEINKITRREWV